MSQLAPPGTPGWTHIWDGAEQLAISDEVAGLLCLLGLIEYSGLYRVYRPVVRYTDDAIEHVSCEEIRSKVLRNKLRSLS